MNGSLSAIHIWGMPLLLALLSVIGLIAALLTDGIGDIVSWITLAAPIAIVLRFALRTP